MHTYSRHLVGGHKSELVWDLYIVQQPSRFHCKNTANKKTTPKATEQTKPKPNKKQAPKTQRGKWSAVQFSDKRWERGDSIVSTQVLVWQNQIKRLGFICSAWTLVSSRCWKTEAWVVTHSLADFDFHDHRPAVKMNQHPLWYLMSVQLSTLAQR